MAIGFLSASTAMADVTKYPRDGKYCDGPIVRQVEGGTEIDNGPFFMLDMAITPIMQLVEFCEGDIENAKSFWRSYYGYHGCTAESKTGKSIEAILNSRRNIYNPTYDPVWIFVGENPQFCETVRNKCILPPVFTSELKDTFDCRLDEKIKELRRGAEEIEKRDAQ